MIKRTTISLSVENIGHLKELARKEHRPIGCQIIHMMEFYMDNHKEL